MNLGIMSEQDTIKSTDKLFFDHNDISKTKTFDCVNSTLNNCNGGELYFENTDFETLYFTDSRIQNISQSSSQGFGFRSIKDDTVAFSCSDNISYENIINASKTVNSIINSKNKDDTVYKKNQNIKPLYISKNPLTNLEFSKKIMLLEKINNFARKLDNRVVQVSISLTGSYSHIQILKKDYENHADLRPLVRLNVQIIVESNDKKSSGSSGYGGRSLYNEWIDEKNWKRKVKEALRLAILNLDAKPAPAGELPVVLGHGWPGVMLHEAVGHGLEGDFNRKGTSMYSNKIGERVASKGVNVFDDGTIINRRGSLTIDDEGVPTQKNLLIEDGILVKYMQDTQNAYLMDVETTGNGRRQSFAHCPMPRMTNTYLDNGSFSSKEIIESVDKGIYAVNFGGGQVDITSGDFVFSSSEAYMIENGKIKYPIKGATLIGNGANAMHKIKMIGNDLKLDEGIGTCGKDGQGVPVGVGQPTLLMDGITIGGTNI